MVVFEYFGFRLHSTIIFCNAFARLINLGIKLHTPFITEGNDILSSLAEDTTKNMGKNMVKKFATEAQKTTLQKLKESTGNQKIDE
jgi:hypothetical protein